MHKKLHCLWVLLLCSAFWLPVMGDEVLWTYDTGRPLITNADDNDAMAVSFHATLRPETLVLRRKVAIPR